MYNSEAALKKTYLIFIFLFFSFVVWFYLREYPSLYIKFALRAVPLLFHFKGKCLLCAGNLKLNNWRQALCLFLLLLFLWQYHNTTCLGLWWSWCQNITHFDIFFFNWGKITKGQEVLWSTEHLTVGACFRWGGWPCKARSTYNSNNIFTQLYVNSQMYLSLLSEKSIRGFWISEHFSKKRGQCWGNSTARVPCFYGQPFNKKHTLSSFVYCLF